MSCLCFCIVVAITIATAQLAVLVWSPRLKLLYCKYHQFMYTLPNKDFLPSFLPGPSGIRTSVGVVISGQTRGDSTFNDSDSDSDSSTPFRFRLLFQSSCMVTTPTPTLFFERFRLRFNSDSSTPYILIMTPELYKF